jgi:hypothetical protein
LTNTASVHHAPNTQVNPPAIASSMPSPPPTADIAELAPIATDDEEAIQPEPIRREPPRNFVDGAGAAP